MKYVQARINTCPVVGWLTERGGVIVTDLASENYGVSIGHEYIPDEGSVVEVTE